MSEYDPQNQTKPRVDISPSGALWAQPCQKVEQRLGDQVGEGASPQPRVARNATLSARAGAVSSGPSAPALCRCRALLRVKQETGAGRPPPHSHSLATRGHQRQSAGQWPAVPRRGWGSSAGKSCRSAQATWAPALLGSRESPGPERHVRVKVALPRDGDIESPGKLPETSPSEVTLLPGLVPLSPARGPQATTASGQARTLTREVRGKQQKQTKDRKSVV